MKYERLDRRRNKAPRKGARQEFVAIHCDYVAAKYQRMIDKIKIKKEDKN